MQQAGYLPQPRPLQQHNFLQHPVFVQQSALPQAENVHTHINQYAVTPVSIRRSATPLIQEMKERVYPHMSEHVLSVGNAVMQTQIQVEAEYGSGTLRKFRPSNSVLYGLGYQNDNVINNSLMQNANGDYSVSRILLYQIPTFLGRRVVVSRVL